MQEKSYEQIVVKTSVVSIIVNVFLSILKFVAGFVANSGAMIADAVHSASDVFTSFIVIVGANIGGKESDKEHPYGHERLECVVSIILANILLLVGIAIGYKGYEKIAAGNYAGLQIPGILALVAAVISIAVKEGLYWYTIKKARKIDSVSLKADAWHHRSDSLSSIGSFVGILGARMGYPVLDPVASVVISVFIVKVSIEIFNETIDKLIDRSCDEQTVEKMKDVIKSNQGVMGIDLIKTRLFGSRIYADIEISVDSSLSLIESHKIVENVHCEFEKEFPKVKHCMVRANPAKDTKHSDKLEN